MQTNIHYGDTCEVARKLMKHLPNKNELASAMEAVRKELNIEVDRPEYWKLHPNDLGAALVELLVEGGKEIAGTR